jgi:cytochrome c-type biogenesis protein CcmH/NrfF
MTILRSFRTFLLAVALSVVLVASTQPSTPSIQARIGFLESVVKCPACDNLTVAQSNAPSSVALRHEIETLVRAGRSNDQIFSSIQAQYGTNITVTPSTSGIGVLLWAVPSALLVGAALTVARIGRRR